MATQRRAPHKAPPQKRPHRKTVPGPAAPAPAPPLLSPYIMQQLREVRWHQKTMRELFEAIGRHNMLQEQKIDWLCKTLGIADIDGKEG